MDAATLVWMAPAPPDDAQARALTSYARAHGLSLSAPTDQVPTPLGVDPRLAEDVERLLERARDAMAARDDEAFDRLLGAAESTLEAHPELAQAAWLRAELERTRATHFDRMVPADPARAAAAWAVAAALDGGRVPGVGEPAGRSQVAPPSTLTLPEALLLGATVRFDGQPTASLVISTRAGKHAVVVEVDGAPTWASWIDAPPGTSALFIPAPELPACSQLDVRRARAAGDTVEAHGVRCPAWLAATATADDPAIHVATCAADHCGRWQSWQPPPLWTFEPRREAPPASWPGWASWGVAGAGALVATSIVIAVSGVLAPAPSTTEFVVGGVHKQ